MSALESMVFIVLSIWIVLITSELHGSKGKLIVLIENNLGSFTNVKYSSSLMMPF
jgi:hypothetical protein